MLVITRSLPPRERGLKSESINENENYEEVAPPAGAWIEITIGYGGAAFGGSLPPRERGLKFRAP